MHMDVQSHGTSWRVRPWWSAECWVKNVCYDIYDIKTSVIYIFVGSDSQYDLTAVFDGQPYGLACIRLAKVIN